MPSPRHLKRDRVGGIVVTNGRILMMRRVRKGFGTYYVFPGGGVEPGEREAPALQRELLEETGLHATVGRRLFFGDTPSGATHSYWLAEAPFRPVAMPRHAEERHPDRVRERGTTDPVWVPVTKFRQIRVLPPKVHRLVAIGIKNGWPARPVAIGRLWRSGRRRAVTKNKTRS